MKILSSSMFTLCISILGLLGCVSEPPSIPSATAENTTAEGLVRVENSRYDEVYVRPGFDLTEFNVVILAPVSVSYKSTHPDNELNKRQLDLMKRYFREELEAAFSESGKFSVGGTETANALLVRAGIVDLEINVPTDSRAIRRSTVFVASSGKMTLVAEVHDAQSQRLLVRIKDRHQAREIWHKATTVSEWAEVRSAFRHWARIAQERIDWLYANKS